jgi:hypothetical protein
MQKTLGSRRLLSGLAAGITLLVTLPVAASEEYPATGFFLDGLTEESRWSEIRAKPGIKAEFPYVAFETTYVPLESLRRRRHARDREPTPRHGRPGAGRAAESPGRSCDCGERHPHAGPAARGREPWRARAAGSHAVSGVAQWVERGLLRERIFLFEKLWPVPVCSGK